MNDCPAGTLPAKKAVGHVTAAGDKNKKGAVGGEQFAHSRCLHLQNDDNNLIVNIYHFIYMHVGGRTGTSSSAEGALNKANTSVSNKVRN